VLLNQPPEHFRCGWAGHSVSNARRPWDYFRWGCLVNNAFCTNLYSVWKLQVEIEKFVFCIYYLCFICIVCLDSHSTDSPIPSGRLKACPVPFIITPPHWVTQSMCNPHHNHFCNILYLCMATVRGLLDSEVQGIISIQNVGTYLPSDTLSHLKSLEASKSLLKRSWVCM
jgi:hypothetical protein